MLKMLTLALITKALNH